MTHKWQRCFFSSSSKQWRIKQITKSNFSRILPQVKERIHGADFICVSSQKTGTFSAPWRRILPIDTPETAYCKSRDAAERFELLHFTVCPITFQGTKVIAYPYNFHLFPRDELNIGMPSYSFSCQTSYLTSMAQEGFDFNTCIYNGISYLSRVQESASKHQNGNCIPTTIPLTSSKPSFADAIFLEGTKSRVKHWRDACKDSSGSSDGALMKSLRKHILGSEVYGTRPCINIDVCTDNQVPLVAKMLNDVADDLVPLIIPHKNGTAKGIRVVLASSQEDRNLLMEEIQTLEEEQNKHFRGFREVIDAMSASCKPIVAYNCLTESAFIHSKFLAHLPSTMAEFMCSLRLVFPCILDVNHLMKSVRPLRKANNLHSALSYIKRQFFAPVEMETPYEVSEDIDVTHGHDVLRIAYVFAKLCSILKIFPSTGQLPIGYRSMMDFENAFYPCCVSIQEPLDAEPTIQIDKNKSKQVSTEDLIFLWGYENGISPDRLRKLLCDAHDAFHGGFQVRIIDDGCAVVGFEKSGSAERFLKDVESGEVESGALLDLIVGGLRVAGYNAYERVCKLGVWEGKLPNSLERALLGEPVASTAKTGMSEEHKSESMMLELSDL
ncbi:hypothetical protein AMTRI_Chr06g175170 [Amborella trichopoda]